MKNKTIFAVHCSETLSRERFFFLLLVFFLGFLALYYRSFYLHVAPDKRLESLTKSQYTAKLEQATSRGNIYDLQGEELAISVPTDSVALRPSKVRDEAEMIATLSNLLALPKAEVAAKVHSPKKYVWIKRGLSPEQSQQIRKVKLEGIELVKEAKRYYPNRELASQILGAVGGDGEGLGGGELYYEEYLRGDPEKAVAFRDARGKTLQMDENAHGSNDVSNLHLTIRKNIQYAAESELEETCKTYHAKTCTAVVMDPRTGAILAMASYPHFNPNDYGYYDLSLWKNLAVTDSFEPGSVFKVILAASALESGLVSPDDQFFCEHGSFNIGSNTIHDHEGYGLLSFRQILKFSSNIGTFKVAQKIGKGAFARVMNDFGFGSKVGVDYPGEAGGQVRPMEKWQDIDFANMAFGQGVGVTALQITNAFSTIAAHGLRMKPYLVAKITNSDGATVWEAEPTPIKQVISERAAHQLTEMMKEVTLEGGTGTKAYLPGYSVAGKTGTAQKLDHGSYSHSKFMSSFVGFVPADQPRLTILVTVDEPQGQVYGGQVAAPAFRRIAWSALRELGVSPDSSHEGGKIPLPVIQASLTQASAVPLGLEVPGNGNEEGAKDVSVVEPRELEQFVRDYVVPDFSGLSMRQVLKKMDRTGMVVQFHGTGLAVTQKPASGSTMKRGGVCEVTFQSRLLSVAEKM